MGELCVLVGLADLLTEALAHAASIGGTIAGASILLLGAAWLSWGLNHALGPHG